VREIQVKRQGASSDWIWGGFRMSGQVLGALHQLWREREGRDAYVGTLVNEYIARGGVVTSRKAGSAYFDVGTLDGYRRAMRCLDEPHGTLLAPPDLQGGTS